MERRWVKTVFVFLGLVLVSVLPGAPAVRDETPSVWERVQKVDDPELGELIRAAMRNHWEPSKRETLAIIRKVTLSYAQIKLLDQQILQVSKRIEAVSGPAEMRYELLLAKAELESKLMTELTTLREMLGIIPKYPFDKQDVEALSAWFCLNAIDDDHVYVLEVRRPFMDYWAMLQFESVGVMSQAEVLELIRNRVAQIDNLPIRVDIVWNIDAAEELRDKVVAVVREADAEMQADVRLGRNGFIGSGEAGYYLREGTITTFYPAPVQKPEGPANALLVNGPVDLRDLDQHILWRITYQWNVPLTFHIEYDQASADLGKRFAERVKAIAEDLGLTDWVVVKAIAVEPLPETAFLGRWRAITNGEVREVVLKPERRSELNLDRNPDGTGEPRTMSVPWYLMTDMFIIDLNEVYAMGHRYLYRGHLDNAGHLVLDRGLIQPQGSFGSSGGSQIVLEKVH